MFIQVNVSQQRLLCWQQEQVLQDFPVSTASNGLGEQNGSLQTPRGWHIIRAKIGEGLPINSVLVGRRPTGEIYSPALASAEPNRDWILTRILWLSGLEVGKNRLGQVDTMWRYIYIHGTPDQINLGVPNSNGCIRMHNQDLLKLFDQLEVGTKVFIGDKVDAIL